MTFAASELIVPSGWVGVPTRQLINARSGSALWMSTAVQLVRADDRLVARFVCAARSIRATMTHYKDKVWQEGAVQVYLRPPGDPRLYEFQLSPLGTTRDLLVHDPGTPAQVFDDSWSCEGLATAAWIHRDEDGKVEGWEAAFMIPLAAMVGADVASAAGWRVGVFRLECDPVEFGALAADPTAGAHADVFLVDLDSWVARATSSV